MPDPDFPYDWYPEHTPLKEIGIVGKVLAYCAEEVRRQGDTPWHVWRMWNAWWYAVEESGSHQGITKKHILTIGSMMDEANRAGFRQNQIRIGTWWGESSPVGAHWATIEERIDDWVNKVALDAFGTWDDAYKAFEDIHPFADGNGRTGKVLFNWLNGSLLDPVWPHNFWDISNP